MEVENTNLLLTELVQMLEKESTSDEQNSKLCNELIRHMARSQANKSKCMELITVLLQKERNGMLKSLVYELPCPSTSCEGYVSLIIQPRISDSGTIEYECPLKLSKTCMDGKVLADGWRVHVRKTCFPKMLECPGAPLCTQSAATGSETPSRPRRPRMSSASSFGSGASSSAFSSLTLSSSCSSLNS